MSPTPFLRPRLELWSDLAARPGARRLDFVPDDDVLACETPDMVDRSGQGTLTLRAASRVVPQLRPRHVIRLVDWASDGVVASTEEWRVLADVLRGGSGAGQVTVTLVSPLLDWSDLGRIRVVSGTALPVWDLTGFYTPADALQLALDWLTAHGETHWQAGVIERTDVLEVSLTSVTALQVVSVIETTFALEAVPRRVSDTVWALDLLNRRGSGANIPVLRTTGMLQQLERTRDATTLATAVLPLGANGATIANAAWPVASVTPGTGTTGVIGLQDSTGPFGPVQIDGQYGPDPVTGAPTAYLRKVDGSLTAVTATLRHDGVTSLVTVADCRGVSAGDATTPPDVVEFRADGSGARLIVVSDPTAITTYGRVEVPLERSDLSDARNYAPNPLLADYASPTAAPRGYSITPGTSIHGPVAAIQRVTSGYPPGCPVGDPGYVWQWTVTGGAQYFTAPVLPALDPAPGDDQLSYALVCWIDVDLHDQTNDEGDVLIAPKPLLELRDVGLGNFSLDVRTGDQASGQTWLTLGGAGVTLGTLRRLQLRLSFPTGTIIPAGGGGPRPYDVGDYASGWTVYLAAVQLTRTASAQPFVEGAPVNALAMAGVAHLATYRQPAETLSATALDPAEVDSARFADVPLVSGGDVQLEAPEVGLSTRARLVGRPRNRWLPAAASLTLTAAPDPIAASLTAATALSRLRRFSELMRAELAAAASGGSSTSASSAASAPGVITASRTYDPDDVVLRFGAKGDGTTNDTIAVQTAIDAGHSIKLAAAYTCLVDGVNVIGHNMPGPGNRTPGFRIWGGGRLMQAPGATRALLYTETCDDLVIDGLALHGNKASQTSGNYGWYAVNTNFAKITNLLVRDCKGTNIVISNGTGTGWLSDEGTFTGVSSLFSDGHAFYAENSGDMTFQGCHFDFSAWKGGYFVGCYTIAITGTHALTNAEEGIRADGCRGFVIGSGNMLRENGRAGLVLDGGAGGHLVNGTRCLWNSLAGQDSYDGMFFNACPDITVVGCHSNDFFSGSAGYPVNGVSRQRYGIHAVDCPNLIVSACNLSPNHTGAFAASGTTTYKVATSIGLADASTITP